MNILEIGLFLSTTFCLIFKGKIDKKYLIDKYLSNAIENVCITPGSCKIENILATNWKVLYLYFLISRGK